ncbi:hypothetical protein Tco_0788829 [Tanacetum coccineum]
MVDEDKEIDEKVLSSEDVLSADKEGVSTDFEKVSTDRPIVSTDGSKVSTDRHIEGTDEQVKAKSVSREKEKGVEFKDIEETKRSRPTSTRSLLTLKPLPKIYPKDKGKKIEEEDESESESDGIPKAERKFKQLASDEEMARKVQEEWEGEEERKRLAEEEATNEALIRNYDDIKARIEADRLLAERLQEQEREQFTVEERAKFLHDTIATQRKFLAQQRSEAIRNRPPTKNQLRNQMMTYLKHIKRSDEDFISIGSAEDERLIKKMNEKGIDSSKNESVKEEGKEEEEVPEDVTFERVFNSPCFMVKSWLVQDQTVLGKDYSNLLIADSLLKTIWFINAPCYGNEALASPKANELTIPEQTATGKGTSNPFMAGKSSRNKRKQLEKYQLIYFDIGPSMSTGTPLTQEEAEREADKYKKILDEICLDKMKLDGMNKEEEEAIIRIKGEALIKKYDPGAFVILIRLEGKINLNALVDTGSDINVILYRIYKELGGEEVKNVKKGISMLNHSKEEPMRPLRNVLCQVGVTTIIEKFLILDMPIDRDTPILVGRGFMHTCGGILNIIDNITSTFDGICHQTFCAAKTSLDTAESDSDDEEC